MRSVQRTSQFKKDVKRLKKRGKVFEEFKEVIRKLSAGKSLEVKYRDHILSGQYKGTRECHIEPDWLLIYELTEDELILIRTGTHSDLFKLQPDGQSDALIGCQMTGFFPPLFPYFEGISKNQAPVLASNQGFFSIIAPGLHHLTIYQLGIDLQSVAINNPVRLVSNTAHPVELEPSGNLPTVKKTQLLSGRVFLFHNLSDITSS